MQIDHDVWRKSVWNRRLVSLKGGGRLQLFLKAAELLFKNWSLTYFIQYILIKSCHAAIPSSSSVYKGRLQLDNKFGAFFICLFVGCCSACSKWQYTLHFSANKKNKKEEKRNCLAYPIIWVTIEKWGCEGMPALYTSYQVANMSL